MSYFTEIDDWLTDILVLTDEDTSEEAWMARVKKQIKDKILDSYRNGQKAGTTDKPGKSGAPEEKHAAPRKFWPPRGGSSHKKS